MSVTGPPSTGQGRLHLCRRLGQYVWLYRLDRTLIVVKFAPDPVRVAALAQEAAILRRLAPAGVAPQPIAHTTRGGCARLLMQYLPGTYPTIPLDPDGKAFHALRQAVTSAHALGVVHCDLKPSNILLHAGRAWLLDWGLSAPIDTSVPALKRRPYSSGWTHPDMIWGRGRVHPVFDLHALARFCATQYRNVAHLPMVQPQISEGSIRLL